MPQINPRAKLASALPLLATGAAREHRLAAAGRSEVGKLLAAKDLRKLADSDPELNAAVSNASEKLAAAEKSAGAWQKALAEATKQWQGGLAELSKVHPATER